MIWRESVSTSVLLGRDSLIESLELPVANGSKHVKQGEKRSRKEKGGKKERMIMIMQNATALFYF